MVDVWTSAASRCAWQRCRLHTGSEGIGIADSRCDGDRNIDEFARPDGTDHHQHWLAASIITPELFATLVIMAIVTTLMASPLFDLITQGKAANDSPNALPIDA